MLFSTQTAIDPSLTTVVELHTAASTAPQAQYSALPSTCSTMTEAVPIIGVKAVARELLSGDFDVSKASFTGKLVLVRVDFNVPTVREGTSVTDWTRVDAALPTLRLLSGQGAKVVVASHFGRPKPGKMTLEEMKSKFSLSLLTDKLSQELGDAFKGVTECCVAGDSGPRIRALEAGQVCAESLFPSTSPVTAAHCSISLYRVCIDIQYRSTLLPQRAQHIRNAIRKPRLCGRRGAVSECRYYCLKTRDFTRVTKEMTPNSQRHWRTALMRL